MEKDFKMTQNIRTMKPVSGLMIATGSLLLASWSMDLDLSFGHSLWQLYIIIPGVIVLTLGSMDKAAGKAILPLGMIIALTGCLLAYQDWADHYQSWAYAWIISGPFAYAAGLVLHGIIHSDATAFREGKKSILICLALFVPFAAVFELVFDISGYGLTVDMQWGLMLPLILIGSGVFVGLRYK